MMKGSIQIKLFALCIFLVLITAISISASYYTLTKHDKHRESQQRIQAGFNIFFDDYQNRLADYTTKMTEALRGFTFRWALERYGADDTQIGAPHFIAEYMGKAALALEDVGYGLAANRLMLYASDKRLFCAYLQEDNQATVGVYAQSSTDQDTYIPANDPDEPISMLFFHKTVVPDAPLPSTLPSSYPEPEIPDSLRIEHFRDGQILGIRVIAPVIYKEKTLGVLVADVFYTPGMVSRYAELSKTEVNLFAGTQLSVGTLPAQPELDADALRRYVACDALSRKITTLDVVPVTFEEQGYYQGQCAFQNAEGESVGAITVSLSQKIEQQEIAKLLRSVLLVAVLVSLFAVLFSQLVSRKSIRLLQQLIQYLDRLAKGDLLEPITEDDQGDFKSIKNNLDMLFNIQVRCSTNDELGILSRSFHSMIAYLQQMAHVADNISHGDMTQMVAPRSEHDALGKAYQRMTEYLHRASTVLAAIAGGDLHRAGQVLPELEASVQAEAETFGQTIRTMMMGLQALIEQIRESADAIAATGSSVASLTGEDIRIVQNVQDSMNHIMESMTAMGRTVEDVANNMVMLSSSVEQTSSAIAQMTTAITIIASNTTDLSQQTDQAATVLETAVHKLAGVTESTEVSKELSQATIRDAFEGQQAVEQVKASMDGIQQTNQEAVAAITRFEKLSGDIGTILDVIQDVTEQTTLLALNASIIAAQSGSHGRGFAVIADEIKNLANQVSVSTKGIADIVKTVRQETKAVVQMIREGASQITEGVSRTQQAREMLQKIIGSAKRSSTMVSDIADALNEQKETGYAMIDVMKRLNTLTSEIRKASNEEKEGAVQINAATQHISKMATQTQEATAVQLDEIRELLEMAHTVKDLNAHNLDSSRQINQATTTDLANQAQQLLESIDRFKLNNSTA